MEVPQLKNADLYWVYHRINAQVLDMALGCYGTPLLEDEEKETHILLPNTYGEHQGANFIYSLSKVGVVEKLTPLSYDQIGYNAK